MNAKEAAQAAVKEIRRLMNTCEGSEIEVMNVFSEEIGSEVTGMDMRLDELEEEEDAK